MENNNNLADQMTQEESLSIKQFLEACAKKWKWFLISILCFTFLGVAYVMTRQPKYERTMAVLIKNQNEGGGAGNIANAFSSLGLVSTNTNVYNELISLTSPAVMSEVVKDLDLQNSYLLKGFPHGTTLYGTNLPFVVEFLDLPDTEAALFKADVNLDGSMELHTFKKFVNGDEQKFDATVKVPQRFCTVKTPLGKVKFSPNPAFSGVPFEKRETIVVMRNTFLSALEGYTAQLKGELADRDAEVINLSIDDVSKQRADDILEKVLEVYTEKWIRDKNRISEATSDFISDRLSRIESELNDVDNNIMVYRKNNLMPDLAEAGKLNLASTQQTEQEILDATSRLSMAQYVAEYVKNPANSQRVIPINTGGTSPQLETQIANYNSLLLARNNLAESTSDVNPIVKDYDAQLKGMHEAIERAMNAQVVNLATTLRNLQGEKGKLQGQLAQGPEMQKYLQSVGRQLKVKEQLYLFLLQKREENQLTQKFTADNTRIITPPMGPQKPVSPKKMLTIAIAFLFGLALPGVTVYIRESSNTKIRTRKDLEKMTTPVIGEIPFIGKRENALQKMLKRKPKTKELERISHVVSPGNRDVMNESFRIVRGNLDFMMRNNNGGEVIMISSLNPGSGKSFITYNLCASFAIKGKRVLLIDCDLRHGSASQYVGMPSKGIAEYLTGHTKDWRKYVVRVNDSAEFDVLPIGHRPPNPAELLETDNMKELIKEAKENYDIIFMDCPPIDIVVDTQVLSPLADRTLIVVRAGLLEKSAIADIESFYKNYRFKNISVLLNATLHGYGHYGSRGYYSEAYGS